MVTGGAGMIGGTTVRAFLQAGALVTLVDITPEKFTFIHENLFSVKADISSEEQVENAFELAKQRFGVVQVCVALGSMDLGVLGHYKSIVDLPLSQWRRTFEVNVQGTFLTARAWLRQIQQSASRGMKNIALVIVGSESGRLGVLGNPDYSAGKSAVQYGLVQSLKNDVVRIYEGARVNAIAPGPVETPKWKSEIGENPEQLYLEAQATSALGTTVPMSAVAKGILYLSSDSWSSHVTGQVLNVDSGKFGSLMWSKGERE